MLSEESAELDLGRFDLLSLSLKFEEGLESARFTYTSSLLDFSKKLDTIGQLLQLFASRSDVVA